MFGWLKKRLATRLQKLADAAQIVVGCALTENFIAKSSLETSDPQQILENAAVRAAAGANYLFGKDTDPIHIQLFDMIALRAEINDWLATNAPFQELVVQSLRVRNVVAYILHGNTPLIGEPILSEFGHNYPDEPNPATFEALVHRTIQLLPDKVQEDVQFWMKKTQR